MADNALTPALADPGDLNLLANELQQERTRRKLERQDARARAPKSARGRLSQPPSVDAALYANVGRYAGNVVLSVFEQIGGVDAMADWAEENPTDFYTKTFSKIITAPKQIEVGGTITLEEAVKALDLQEGKDYHVVETEAPRDADGDDPSIY